MKLIIIFLLLLPIIIFSTEEVNHEKTIKNQTPALNETNSGEKKNNFYYFNPKKEGAAAFYNPLQVVIEGGFGALYNQKIDKFDWNKGAENLFDDLRNPIDKINEYGWGKFFYYEFVPHTGSGKAYFPNWAWHFIGGGFRNKLLEEYYIYHNYEYPKLYAYLTMYSMHFINELIQAERSKHKASVDCLPDLFFFDWVGKLFFEIDFVNNIFSNHLHLRDWSYQTQIEIYPNRLLNNGQLYWIRYEIYNPISLGLLTGEQITSINITYETQSKKQFTFGAGLKPKAFFANDKGDIESTGNVFDFGLYYSVDDNPFIVITYEPELGGSDKHNNNIHRLNNPNSTENKSNENSQKLIINIYPGFLKFKDTTVGISLMYQKEAFFIGFSSANWPAGFIFSTPQDEVYLNAY